MTDGCRRVSGAFVLRQSSWVGGAGISPPREDTRARRHPITWNRVGTSPIPLRKDGTWREMACNILIHFLACCMSSSGERRTCAAKLREKAGTVRCRRGKQYCLHRIVSLQSPGKDRESHVSVPERGWPEQKRSPLRKAGLEVTPHDPGGEVVSRTKETLSMIETEAPCVSADGDHEIDPAFLEEGTRVFSERIFGFRPCKASGLDGSLEKLDRRGRDARQLQAQEHLLGQ